MAVKLLKSIAGASSILVIALGALSTPASAVPLDWNDLMCWGEPDEACSYNPALERNGVCDEGEVCLYYGSDLQGSVSDFRGSPKDYGAYQPSCFEFKGEGAGQGECVKNNAASVWNRMHRNMTVYYNSNYSGASQVIPGQSTANLNSSLIKQNASHDIDWSIQDAYIPG
jgi:hypothetical protein